MRRLFFARPYQAVVPKADFGASGILLPKTSYVPKSGTMPFFYGKKSLTPYPKVTLWYSSLIWTAIA
jgi:hypothetical protein